MNELKQLVRFFWHLPQNLAIAFVKLYQKTLSPDHGPLKSLYPYGYCKFEPTCSQYTKEKLAKDGFIIGSLKGLWRILSCNPCSKGNRLP